MRSSGTVYEYDLEASPPIRSLLHSEAPLPFARLEHPNGSTEQRRGRRVMTINGTRT